MRSSTRSILESLSDIIPEKERTLVIESRGNHLITATISLLENIQSYYGDDIAIEMEKRFISAIRNRNAQKFARGARRIAENQKPKVTVN